MLRSPRRGLPRSCAEVHRDRTLRPERTFAIGALLAALSAVGCEDNPPALVEVNNEYPANSGLVVYQALWQAASFQNPIAPGTSSPPQTTVPASDNTAYVVLAPNWDPSSSVAPSNFLVLQSRTGFAVNLGDTLQIPVDDAAFAGNCAAGSTLTQQQADSITQFVFPSIFGSLKYEAATCTTTHLGDAGAD